MTPPASHLHGVRTLRVLSTSLLIFVCYFIIGLQLAVVPGFVHLHLGYSAVLAGLAISSQYAATLISRPIAGRKSDSAGAKQTVRIGLVVCAASGLLFAAAVRLEQNPWMSLSVLIASRLLLGVGESGVAAGATLWGIGRVGAPYTAQVISWAGIASYGALAAGGPCGLWLERSAGTGAVGAAAIALALIGFLWASALGAVRVERGDRLSFRQVLRRVLPYGTSLTLAGFGFGTIASFITLFYASRHWPNAGWTLSLFAGCFVVARLLFSGTIRRWGGYRIALLSLAIECAGLFLLAFAPAPALADFGAAVAGFGFSLVFPALGVEAVRHVPAQDRGTALAVYAAFIDLSLGISGPIAGAIVWARGYPPIFLFAAAGAALSIALVFKLYRARAVPAVVKSPAAALTVETRPEAARSQARGAACRELCAAAADEIATSVEVSTNASRHRRAENRT